MEMQGDVSGRTRARRKPPRHVNSVTFCPGGFGGDAIGEGMPLHVCGCCVSRRKLPFLISLGNSTKRTTFPAENRHEGGTGPMLVHGRSAG